MARRRKRTPDIGNLLDDNTITVIVKHKGKVYAKGQRVELDDDRGLYNTLVALDKTVFALQKTVFYELAGKPDDVTFDLEQEPQNWIVKKPAGPLAQVNVSLEDSIFKSKGPDDKTGKGGS